MITDRETQEILGGYSRLRTPDLHQATVFEVYGTPLSLPPELGRYLTTEKFGYFILDKRILSRDPSGGWFPGYVSRAVSVDVNGLAQRRSVVLPDERSRE